MPKIDVLDVKGNVVGDVELSEAIFGIEPNEHVVHEVVVALLANRRQGTRSALTRSEVRGGGRKPWRQKEQAGLAPVPSDLHYGRAAV